MGEAVRVKALVLSAGLGTRFKSEKPKVLHELLGKPMLWYVLNTLKEGGIEDIAVVVGYGAQEVKRTFGEGLRYFYQENPRGGTADAVLSAVDFWRNSDDYLLIINGDSPLVSPETIKNMQRFLFMVEEYEGKKLAGVVLTAFLQDPTGYGRVIKEQGTDRIIRIVEEKEADPNERSIKEVNAGLYIFYTPYLLEALFKIKPSQKTGELYLTDVVHYMSLKGYEVRSFMASEPTEALGVNTRWELSFAENILRLKLIKFWAQRGVTFHIPETVWIEPDVTLSKNVEVYPFAVLKGRTKVQEGVVIKQGAIVENSRIEKGATIEPYSVVVDSTVEEGAVIGPFAHLREGTKVGKESVVGNFVEVKRSILGQRVKAKHLAYIGDSEVHKEANIGAGVVTANYDGKQKHRTIIGERAFVGSNSLLIAPLKLGKLSYVAGGSVVSKDVPDGALAVERAKLKILKGKGEKLLGG